MIFYKRNKLIMFLVMFLRCRRMHRPKGGARYHLSVAETTMMAIGIGKIKWNLSLMAKTTQKARRLDGLRQSSVVMPLNGGIGLLLPEEEQEKHKLGAGLSSKMS